MDVLQVAEMTGRKGRIVRRRTPGTNPTTLAPPSTSTGAVTSQGSAGRAKGPLVYELRAKPDSGDMESLNSELLWRCGRKRHSNPPRLVGPPSSCSSLMFPAIRLLITDIDAACSDLCLPRTPASVHVSVSS
jgi:hypothetical protein